MKISVVMLNKKAKSTTFCNGDYIETALMGAALIFKASEIMAKDKKITVHEAKRIITDSIMETKGETLV